MTIPMSTMINTSLRSTLPDNHVLSVMMDEHDLILGFLDELTEHRAALLKGVDDEILNSLKKVVQLGELLVDAESHHQREEQVLFPAIEALGASGPPQMMVQEHEWLRVAKGHVITIASSPEIKPIDKVVGDLAPKIAYLTSMLSSHIAKENQVLYPLAYQLLSDPLEWNLLKAACDKIGYCPFTPSR